MLDPEDLKTLLHMVQRYHLEEVVEDSAVLFPGHMMKQSSYGEETRKAFGELSTP